MRQALADFTERGRAAAPSPAELTAAHLAIHRAFVGLTESPRLVAMAEALTAEIRLALAKVDRIRRNAREQVHSHAALLDLLERGDVDGAADELDPAPRRTPRPRCSTALGLARARHCRLATPGRIEP